MASAYRLIILVFLTDFALLNCGAFEQNQYKELGLLNGTPNVQDSNTNEPLKSEETTSISPKDNVTIHGTCTENCKEDAIRSSNETDKTTETCPPERRKLCLLIALSKIAKVQLADHSYETSNRISARTFNSARRNEEGLISVRERHEGKGSISDLTTESVEVGNFENSSTKQPKSGSIHCRAIRDVYIPDVRQKLPAFACKYGNRTFVLSSERFLQDRRSYLNINIDKNIFQNLKILPKISRSNSFNVIPALLVLKTNDDNYQIRTHENISTEAEVNYNNQHR